MSDNDGFHGTVFLVLVVVFCAGTLYLFTGCASTNPAFHDNVSGIALQHHLGHEHRRR